VDNPIAAVRGLLLTLPSTNYLGNGLQTRHSSRRLLADPAIFPILLPMRRKTNGCVSLVEEKMMRMRLYFGITIYITFQIIIIAQWFVR
jgi:hypothetical protein